MAGRFRRTGITAQMTGMLRRTNVKKTVKNVSLLLLLEEEIKIES